MAAFENLDWQRFDVWALAGFSGIATIDMQRQQACRSWLSNHHYTVDSIDCSNGVGSIIVELGQLLRWEEQFGYRLDANNRNLDALRDGFRYLEVTQDEGGRVFELDAPDLIWQEDSHWFMGLLSIAQEQSHQLLALGRRFFTLLVPADSKSPLIGQVFSESRVPGPFWSPCKEVQEFST